MLCLTPQNISLLTDMQVKASFWITVIIRNSQIPRECLQFLGAKVPLGIANVGLLVNKPECPTKKRYLEGS